MAKQARAAEAHVAPPRRRSLIGAALPRAFENAPLLGEIAVLAHELARRYAEKAELEYARLIDSS
jgi:hypothetical protein